MALLDCAGRDVTAAGSAGRIDLVAGSNSISIPSGDYCGVRIDMGTADASRTVHVQGIRSDGVLFTIDDPNPLGLSLTSTTPFTVHPEEMLIVAFDAAAWFGGTFLQDASTVAGRVTIDATSNSAALAPFGAQMAADLHRDPNDNGHVDPADGPPIASGHSGHAP